ncbi:adenylyltransferase and sulfurtransferase MOCS3 [alpha proteobacterium Q-1]|nr:adenylyltransferase and sulfurtransferase MOCS3 [alpha proteobacterium Q-1]
MELSDQQLERYARHIILHDVGGSGQRCLLASRVLLIGAGGIGSPAALYLAAAGVGHLGILDDDRVSLSNLQRQILYGTSDIGRSKGQAAAERLGAINPDVAVDVHEIRLDAGNAVSLLAGYDLILDGSDNFTTRLAVNEAAVALEIPLVSAAIGPFEGQLSVFKGYLPDRPCYQCLVPAPPADEAQKSCAETGVLGAVAGVMGSWAALEAMRELMNVGESLAGRMILFNARDAITRTVGLGKDPACAICSDPGMAHQSRPASISRG